jgi:predicted AlkP superfamily phosphohydrolase/phosphomutase
MFSGNNLKKAPDILIFFKNYYFPFGYVFNLNKKDLIIENDTMEIPLVTGIESGNGLLCISDENIDNSAKNKNCKTQDFTPTLLYLLDLPIPKDTDGKVITRIFKKTYLQSHPITYEEPKTKKREQKLYSKKETKKINLRLERLGYF